MRLKSAVRDLRTANKGKDDLRRQKINPDRHRARSRDASASEVWVQVSTRLPPLEGGRQ